LTAPDVIFLVTSSDRARALSSWPWVRSCTVTRRGRHHGAPASPQHQLGKLPAESCGAAA
jgi:hypothetical protein